MEREPESLEVRAAREVVGRAIRRLNVLEYMILVLAVGVALVGGAVVAWLLSSSFGLNFRWVWAGASLLLFLVPAGVMYVRDKRSSGLERPPSERPGGNEGGETNTEPKDPHG